MGYGRFVLCISLIGFLAFWLAGNAWEVEIFSSGALNLSDSPHFDKTFGRSEIVAKAALETTTL